MNHVTKQLRNTQVRPKESVISHVRMSRVCIYDGTCACMYTHASHVTQQLGDAQVRPELLRVGLANVRLREQLSVKTGVRQALQRDIAVGVESCCTCRVAHVVLHISTRLSSHVAHIKELRDNVAYWKRINEKISSAAKSCKRLSK